MKNGEDDTRYRKNERFTHTGRIAERERDMEGKPLQAPLTANAHSCEFLGRRIHEGRVPLLQAPRSNGAGGCLYPFQVLFHCISTFA